MKAGVAATKERVSERMNNNLKVILIGSISLRFISKGNGLGGRELVVATLSFYFCFFFLENKNCYVLIMLKFAFQWNIIARSLAMRQQCRIEVTAVQYVFPAFG